MNSSVLNYLDAGQERFVSELAELLKFPSISAQSTHRADMEQCAVWLRDHCQRIGLSAEVKPTRGNPVVLARTPREAGQRRKPHFLVYGHYDVQPPDPLDLWQSGPFEPELRNGCIFARASCDNKGQHFAHH